MIKLATLQLLLPLTLLSTALGAANLTIVNDSLYPLTAEIYTAQGDKIGSVRMLPGQSHIWYYDIGPFQKQYDSPYTPFTVRWLCQNSRPYDYTPPPPPDPKKNSKQKTPPQYNSDYGSWTQVPPSATVNAMGSNTGSKSCVTRKKPPPPEPSPNAPRPPKRNYSNQGFNNFSNDGGQTWSNDGGPGWDQTDEDFSGESEFQSDERR